MEINAELEGIEESLKQLSQFVAAEERALQEALEWLLLTMINYVKTHGSWTDRTSNLRNSIAVNYEAMQEWPTDTPKETLEAMKEELEKPVIHIQGDDYEAILSAGMEYAIWVELKSGYWVLQGAIDRFEPLIEKYFAGKMAVEKLDLQQAASVQYIKQYGGSNR